MSVPADGTWLIIDGEVFRVTSILFMDSSADDMEDCYEIWVERPIDD